MLATQISNSVRCVGGAVLLLLGAAGASAEPDLARYLDNDRVLLVFAKSTDDPSFAAQKRILAAAEAGTGDRDLVLVPAVGADAVELRRRFKVADGSFASLLIGKDGETKMRSSQPIVARTLFMTIDAMPMRRAEQKR